VGLGGWLALVAAAVAGIAGALALAGRARLKRGMPPLSMTAGSVRTELHELTRQLQPNCKAGLNGKAEQR
jgi:hypothetical protein